MIKRMRLTVAVALVVASAVGPMAGQASAEFPYPSPPQGQDPYQYEDYMFSDSEPSDMGEGERWKYSSKDACELYGTLEPEPSFPGKERNCNPLVSANPQEQFGVTGSSVDRAWGVSTGRPDVTIAVMDSGIEWQNEGAMDELANKTWLNHAELPLPGDASNAVSSTPRPRREYDVNNDGVFNLKDYCPNRSGVGNCTNGITDLNKTGFIDPEDLIFKFSDGIDQDDNGFTDDFVGWDSYEDDNDPFDEVDYGHGTGEAIDSVAEANNGGGSPGTCPNCLVMHMRVGDSFIADVNDAAEAMVYATDNGASVLQSALGTLNNSRFAQEAIDYAYRRGVALIASAADESAGHHNQPSVLEHAITFNSVGEPQSLSGGPPGVPQSYLEFRGCTNYGAYITASVPSNSCSSEATGRMAGVAGLMYAAAKNRFARNPSSGGTGEDLPLPILDGPILAPTETFADYGVLDGPGGVPAGRMLSAEEIDQIVSRTADDINFTTPLPYTDRTIPESKRYGATEGWDPFFGYGRINARRMLRAIDENRIPPEADITSPKWFAIESSTKGNIQVEGFVASRRTPKFSYDLQWAPWSWKGPDRNLYRKPAFTSTGVTIAAPGDQSSPRSGLLGTISAAAVKAALGPKTQLTGSSGPAVDPATGRGENENIHIPDKFSVILRVVVTAKDANGAAIQQQVTGEIDKANGGSDPNNDEAADQPLRGVATKNIFFHDDPALFPGYPKDLQGDGAAAPRFADIDDDNQDELIVATSNGRVHAFEPNGSEVPGWPVTTTDINANYGSPGYQSGEITTPIYAATLRSPAVGDLDRDGDLEVAVTDFMGRLNVFDKNGNRLWTQRTDPRFSTPDRADRAAGYYRNNPQVATATQPLGPTPPADPDLVPDAVNRHTKNNRVIRWFMAAASFGNIDPSTDDLEIVVGGADRHFYAFDSKGKTLDGWPLLMRDPAMTGTVNPQTHDITQKEGVKVFDGAKVVTNPAIGDLGGDGLAEVVATVNEQYLETPNSDDPSLGAVSVINDAGNNRLYVLSPRGSLAGGGVPAGQSHPNPNAYLPGWPAKIATAVLQLLPVVGGGPDGAPIVGNVNGGNDLEIGIFGTAGPGYILNKDGRSIYGRDSQGRDRTLLMNAHGSASNSPDSPSIPAVSGAIFSDLTGAGKLQFVAPAAGLGKLLDVVLPEDQLVSDNHISAWELTGTEQAAPRNQLPAFPREVNDLQFLATPGSADIDGDGLEEILEGTAYYDFHAINVAGDEPGMRALADNGWPKFTGGWAVGPPGVGDFNQDGKRDIAFVIREGRLFVWQGNGAGTCAPASWPEWGHDNWATNNITIDAQRPGRVLDLKNSFNSNDTSLINWTAPGEDGPCRRAHSYEIRQSPQPLTNESFTFSQRVASAPAPKAPGTAETFAVPRQRCDTFVALRTWDADPSTDKPANPANPSSVSNNVLVPGTDPACSTPTGATPSPSTSAPSPSSSASPTASPPATPSPTAGASASPTPTPTLSPTGDQQAPTRVRITGDLSGESGENVTLAAMLETQEGPVAGETLRFILDQDTYSAVTDERGEASVTARVDGPPRRTTLRVEYDGNQLLAPSSEEATFKVTGQQSCPDLDGDSRNQIVGTEGDDTLQGTEGDDVICGLGGDDLIDGLGGNDLIIGGSGNDSLRGGDGNDEIKGNSGKDELRGNGGNDELRGGNQNDDLRGNAGDDVMRGQAGFDVLRGGSGDDEGHGGSGNDTIQGFTGNDLLVGNSGNDTMKGAGGRDEIRGGKNDDVISGGKGPDRIRGGPGKDVCVGGPGNDNIRGCER